MDLAADSALESSTDRCTRDHCRTRPPPAVLSARVGDCRTRTGLIDQVACDSCVAATVRGRRPHARVLARSTILVDDHRYSGWRASRMEITPSFPPGPVAVRSRVQAHC